MRTLYFIVLLLSLTACGKLPDANLTVNNNRVDNAADPDGCFRPHTWKMIAHGDTVNMTLAFAADNDTPCRKTSNLDQVTDASGAHYEVTIRGKDLVGATVRWQLQAGGQGPLYADFYKDDEFVESARIDEDETSYDFVARQLEHGF